VSFEKLLSAKKENTKFLKWRKSKLLKSFRLHHIHKPVQTNAAATAAAAAFIQNPKRSREHFHAEV
jgi:hypothetical protein